MNSVTDSLVYKIKNKIRDLDEDNFCYVAQFIRNVTIADESYLVDIAEAIYESAVKHSDKSNTYAQLCKALLCLNVRSYVVSKGGSPYVYFREILVRCCEYNFVTNFMTSESAEAQKNYKLKSVIESQNPQVKLNYSEKISALKFLGHLFVEKLLSAKTMHVILGTLTEVKTHKFALKCFLTLISIIQDEMVSQKQDLSPYFMKTFGVSFFKVREETGKLCYSFKNNFFKQEVFYNYNEDYSVKEDATEIGVLPVPTGYRIPRKVLKNQCRKACNRYC